MNDRRVAIVGAVVALLVAVGIAFVLMRPDAGPEVAAAPAPAPKTKAAPPQSNARHPLRRPADIEAPEAPDERPEASRVTPDIRREMNYAMDGVLRTARKECIDPWLARTDTPETEFVFDAVLWDGRIVDFGMRSLGPKVPDDVVACVADAVWYGEWPEWDLAGELRLQRSIEVGRR